MRGAAARQLLAKHTLTARIGTALKNIGNRGLSRSSAIFSALRSAAPVRRERAASSCHHSHPPPSSDSFQMESVGMSVGYPCVLHDRT